MELTVLNVEDLRNVISKEIRSVFKEHGMQPVSEQEITYTINKVSKRLGMSFNTVKKLCISGEIATTANGRISEKAIQDYLNSKQ